MKSIFADQHAPPSGAALKKALGDAHALWQQVIDFAHAADPAVKDEWKFTGEKTGWSFRVCDKKRVIIYLMPFDKCFQVSMVFGQKAVDQIMESAIDENIKSELKNARVYAEGRGIRMSVETNRQVDEIEQLIRYKIGK